MRGGVRPPPSKSLTQRFLVLAALAETPTVLRGALESDDVDRTIAAIVALGADCVRAADALTVTPATGGGGGAIFCGENGTLLRFMTAVCAVAPGRWTLDGAPRLRERPLGPLLEALRELGAEVAALGVPGRAPVRIEGTSLRGGTCSLDASASSQFLSALLLAAPGAREECEVRVTGLASAPYVDLTLAALASFGGRVELAAPDRYRVAPGPLSAAGTIRVEPDLSAAAYPAAAAALTGGDVLIEGVEAGSAQGDRRWFDVLERMGAQVAWGDGGVRVRGRGLRAVDEDLSKMPDQVPTLAALAPFARGVTRIRNVAHLRFKESDRLRAMSEGLTAMGAVVDESEDGLTVQGTWAEVAPPAAPVTVSAHGDHRIAMSLAVTALRRPGVAIDGWRSVSKSYPEFWRDLDRWLA